MTAPPRPRRLRVAGRETPLSVPQHAVRFGWLPPADRATQTAYQLRVARDADALPDGDAQPDDETLPDGDVRADGELVWDSGAIDAAATSGVPYAGPSLEPDTAYHWTVRTGDDTGSWSAWSEPARFETPVEEWTGEWLAPAGPAYAERAAPAPVFRTTFELDDGAADAVERARLHLAVGGTADARLNGEHVGEAVLDPGVTDYEERVLAATYDVTDALRDGENALAVVLGRERYAMHVENAWAWTVTPWQRDHPELLAELTVETADGTVRTVATDAGEWRVAPSETTADCLYTGDEVDARRAVAWSDPALDAEGGADPAEDGESGANPAEDGESGADPAEDGGAPADSGSAAWATPTVVDGPPGEIDPQVMRGIEPVDELDPVDVTRRETPEDGPATSVVFDFGEVLAGWVRLAIDAPAGTELELVQGEKLTEDGRVERDQGHLDGDFQTDRYVCAGAETPAAPGPVADPDGGIETWEPRFSYKGFQYAELRCEAALPEDAISPGTLTAVVAHNPIEDGSSSGVRTSEELLERIQANTRRSLLSNHHGVPTDTPAYEKHGWTGDAQITAETALLNFRMAPLYRKYLRDMADAQRPSGELPPFVPTSDWGYSEGAHDEPFTAPVPAWDAAYVLMPWYVYRHTGDTEVLAEHFEGMRALVSFLDGFRDEDGVLDEGLGDWFPPGHGEITWRPPEGHALTSTAYFVRMLELLRDVAGLLGRDRHRETYARRAAAARTAFNDAFLDAEAGIYATGAVEEYRQTSNLFPLAYDFVPAGVRDRVLENLIEDVRDTRDGHLNTGILGTKHLLPVLTDAGEVDLAYEVATQREYPSWGHWIEHGMTGHGEAWEVEARSHNHHMFGAIGEWYYTHLAGIRPGAPGFSQISIVPHVPGALESVDARVDTVRGVVGAAWEQTEDRDGGAGDGDGAAGDAGDVRYELSVPATTDAVAHLPGTEASVTAGEPVAEGASIDDLGTADGRTVLSVPPGEWTVTTRRD